MQDEKWTLPKALKIDDPKVQERAEIMREDLAQRSQSPFASLSPAEHARVRAAQIASEMQADLDRINGELKKHPVDELKSARVAIAAQLAEQYAVIGRYDLAAQLHPNKAHREEYKDIVDAIDRSDEYACACPDDRTFIKAEIYSEKHGRVVPLMKCRCGEMNARPFRETDKRLLDQRAHRSKARSLAGDRTPDEAKEILKQHKHTAKDLAK